MKNYIKTGFTVLLSFFVLLALTSCSYGFMNLFSDTGRIEIEFRFVTQNTLNVDRIEYELTPPKGLSSKLEVEIDSSSSYHSLDNTDIGTWRIQTTLYSGDEVVQAPFEYSIEVGLDMTTRLTIEASWAVDGYDILYETQQWEMNDDSAYSNTPRFTVTEMRVNPAVYQDYRSSEETFYAGTWIFGNGFEDYLSLFKLIYPDGFVYEQGHDYSRSSGAVFYHNIVQTEIEVFRTFNTGSNQLNGGYNIRMSDYNGGSYTDEIELALDYSSLMPAPGAVIEESVSESAGYNFFYEFNPAADIGTRLVYLVNSNDPSYIFPVPPSNAMVASFDSGSLSYPGAMFPPGNYELIILAMEHITTTPVDDAALAGVTEPDLRSPYILQTLYDIYGADAGWVCYTSVRFEFI